MEQIRSVYTNSDIQFKGDGYDFTLKDVKANDRQDKFGFNPYFNLETCTIPQYNFRVGYFLSDNFSISFGIDHMKYVMEQDQVVEASGNTGSQTFNNGDTKKLTSDFLKFEHTDGLNYYNLSFDKHYRLKDFGQNFSIYGLSGAGLGFMLPKSNVTLMDNKRHDEFHLAGYGLHALTGLDFIFAKKYLLRTSFKWGYIDMPDIRTTSSESDKASQTFIFGEWDIVFGLIF